MTQNNTFYHTDVDSKKLLARFNEIEGECLINHDKIYLESLSTSLKVRLKCGCMHVEHFGVNPETQGHSARHYVELCNKHSLPLCELSVN